MPGVLIVEAMAQAGAVAVLVEEENRGKIAFFAGIDDCRFKRIVAPARRLTLTCEIDTMRGPIGRGKATAHVGDRARCPRHADVRGGAMIGSATGRPDRDHRPRGARARPGDDERRPRRSYVDTSDEWIRERTGIRERRIAAPGRGAHATSPCRPPGPRSRRRACDAAEIDLLICATVTPDMMFPTSSALMADTLGMPRRGRVRPPRRLHRLHVRDRPGIRDARLGAVEARARRRRRRALEDPRLGRPLDARALRRRRRRRRDGAGRRRAASSASSSAPTAAAASTSATPAAARATSTTLTRSSR